MPFFGLWVHVTMTTRGQGSIERLVFLFRTMDRMRLECQVMTRNPRLNFDHVSNRFNLFDNAQKLPQSQITERLRPCLVTERLEGSY